MPDVDGELGDDVFDQEEDDLPDVTGALPGLDDGLRDVDCENDDDA